jgi:trans-AT polyketide synthase/acyltransferase/oxidoreductase domain-containing protein
MNKNIIYMFSGQGSQYYQMGRELFEENLDFHKWMTDLNDKVYQLTGDSVLEQIYSKKPREQRLNQNLLSFQALFMVQYALARVFLDNQLKPDYLLGESMGEFVSIALAGAMEIEEGVELLVKHCNIMESCCEEGSMIVILDDSDLYYSMPIIRDNSELVSVNHGEHFVISGLREELNIILKCLEEKNIVHRRLPVQFGFHSSAIDPAASLYKEALQGVSIKEPQLPIVSCLCGDVLSKITKDYLWDVIRNQIKLQKAILKMEEKGDNLYIDLGPSGTLANHVDKILQDLPASNSEVHPIMTPFNKDIKSQNNVMEIVSNLNR